jgi:hypothetical protein
MVFRCRVYPIDGVVHELCATGTVLFVKQAPTVQPINM